MKKILLTKLLSLSIVLLTQANMLAQSLTEVGPIPAHNFTWWTQNSSILNANSQQFSQKLLSLIRVAPIKAVKAKSGATDTENAPVPTDNTPPIDPDSVTVDFAKINDLFSQASQETLLQMPGIAKKIQVAFSENSSIEKRNLNLIAKMVLNATPSFPKDTVIQTNVGLSSYQSPNKISLLSGLSLKIDVVKLANKLFANMVAEACLQESSQSLLVLLCPFFPAKSPTDLWNAVLTIHNMTLASLTGGIFTIKKQIKELNQKELEDDEDIFTKEQLELKVNSLSMLRDLLLQIQFKKKGINFSDVETFSVGIKKLKVGQIFQVDELQVFVVKGQMLKTRAKISVTLPTEVTKKIWDVIKVTLYTIQTAEQTVIDAGKVYIRMFVSMLAGFLN